jgi:hypothetical protein
MDWPIPPRKRSVVERTVGKETAGSAEPPRGSAGPSPYDPEVAKLIKIEMNRVWERVKYTRGLTQAQLAAAFEISQSAVSKLLRIDDTHPWTTNYIKIFCQFCRIDFEQEILPKLPTGVAVYFKGWDDNSETDDAFNEECANAIKNHYQDHGITLKPDQIAKLGAQLVLRLRRGASAQDIAKNVASVVLEAALRAPS